MTDGEEVRNSIDGSEVANAVQAGSIGSLHIGGAARENHLRDSYRAAHATFLAIVEVASGITWRVVGSNRRQLKTLTAHCSSLDGLVSDFDLFAPAEVRSAFHRARFAARPILTDAQRSHGITYQPALLVAIDIAAIVNRERLSPTTNDRGNAKLVAAMNDATNAFVEAVRISTR
ncbi:hypothetical protein ACFVZ3_05345 [Kitasatospora purpeofusca]|uniref:hypothetical protein n=1 Tax=Kitasatospora purpeofusca TaxID=67352 RepID=UPI0036496D53